MHLLIDGYNVLFAAGAMPRHSGPGQLARSRDWLLRLLMEHMDTAELQETTIVFDAKDGPRHLAAEYSVRGVRVLFARDHEEADDLIESLINQHATPKKLTVVTSDQRLATAARRRRCRIMPSDEWLDDIEEQRPSAVKAGTDAQDNRDPREAPVSADEVARWLEMFEQDGETPRNPAAQPDSGSQRTTKASRTREKRSAAGGPSKPRASREPLPSNSTSAENPAAVPPEAKPKRPGAAPRSSQSRRNNNTNAGQVPRKTPRDPRKAPKGPDRETGEWSPFPPGYGEDLLNPPTR